MLDSCFSKIGKQSHVPLGCQRRLGRGGAKGQHEASSGAGQEVQPWAPWGKGSSSGGPLVLANAGTKCHVSQGALSNGAAAVTFIEPPDSRVRCYRRINLFAHLAVF